ncbi:hypothetical protein D1872_288750 [compost metagenome]
MLFHHTTHQCIIGTYFVAATSYGDHLPTFSRHISSQTKEQASRLPLSRTVYESALRPIAEQENGHFRQHLGNDQWNDQLLVIEIQQAVVHEQNQNDEREIFWHRFADLRRFAA